MPRPPGHGPGYEIKRQEIIDRAAELFARKGYAATGINEIGGAAGLTKGALYYYIGSKENLLVEIQSRVMRPLLRTARRIARLEVDAVLRLRLLSEALLSIILRRLDHIWVYEHDYRMLGGDNRTRLLRQRGEFEGIISNLLAEAMDAGEFREMNPRLAMLQFLNMHNHTYQWVRPDGSWDAQYLSREYCATLFTGFRAGPGPVDDLEERVLKFREQYPEIVLDPVEGEEPGA
ncbi:TetR/AcrR family transcriptional regulator [Actinomadura latina]|uniref:TetR/AcrR family transcriptional regulator n=1 Tax=Actinomadura latina TaxID=163603 RepID=A0A846Z759_9ACTN|nr:TetR/AcrR family transcriptional regulator [Actinomadura latina]NKZ06488.1 TetR/AcrR family transcriptional regulator [Actinomadura latina]